MKRTALGLVTLVLSSNIFAFAITGSSIVSYSSLPRNTQFEPVGEFRYGIRNDTKINQEYIVKYSICADNKGCREGQRRIPVAPSGSLDDAVKISMPISYNNSGVYNISAYITIEGESVSHHETHVPITIY